MHHRVVIALLAWCCVLGNTHGSSKDNPIMISKCPGLIVGTAYANTTASIIWTTPTASDNIGKITSVKISPPEITKPPHRFSIGQHLIRYTFESAAGYQKHCSFSVFVIEKIHLIKKPSKEINIRTGKTLLVNCLATSTHRIHYMWTKDEAELKRSDRVQWSEEIPGLVIMDTVEDDTGTYSCTAYNGRKGPVESTVTYTTIVVDSHIHWSPWDDWGPCDCKKGTRTRLRSCTTPLGDTALGCKGQNLAVENCARACQSGRYTSQTSKKLSHPLKVAFQRQNTNTRGDPKNRFLDTFYGKMALGSSIAIIAVAFCAAGFLGIGYIHEKQDKNKESKKKRNLADLEKSISNETSSKSDIEALYDEEEEIDRKAYEKRRVISELTPKRRRLGELDEDLQLARSVILEEGVNREHDKQVTAKRKEVARRTSTASCKGSLLESINCSRAVIMEQSDSKASDGNSSSSYHSVSTPKPMNSADDDDNVSMVMTQAVITQDVKAAEIKQVDDWAMSRDQ